MHVDVNEELHLVTLRHDTRDLLARGALLIGVGIAVPAWVQATVPALIVPSLLLTLATAFWLVQALTAVLLLDDVGVTPSASRRGGGRILWSEVADIAVADLRITVTTAGGRLVTGPPADDATLAEALEAAARVGFLPERLRPR